MAVPSRRASSRARRERAAAAAAVVESRQVRRSEAETEAPRATARRGFLGELSNDT